jgi:hypothetical protein
LTHSPRASAPLQALWALILGTALVLAQTMSAEAQNRARSAFADLAERSAPRS